MSDLTLTAIMQSIRLAREPAIAPVVLSGPDRVLLAAPCGPAHTTSLFRRFRAAAELPSISPG